VEDKFPKHTAEELLKMSAEELAHIKAAKEVHALERPVSLGLGRFVGEKVSGLLLVALTVWGTLWANSKLEQVKTRNADLLVERTAWRQRLAGCKAVTDQGVRQSCACDLLIDSIPFDAGDAATKRMGVETMCAGEQQRAASGAQLAEQTQTKAVTDAKPLFDHIDTINSQLARAKEPEEIIRLRAQLEQDTLRRNALIATEPDLKRAVVSITNIHDAVVQVSTAASAIQPNIGPKGGQRSQVLSVKEGYFLRFGDHRILLQYLDKSLGAQIQICKTRDSGSCRDPLKNKEWIGLGKPLQFSDGGKQYRINLEAIDHAGKNPFTLAAYITFETLN